VFFIVAAMSVLAIVTIIPNFSAPLRQLSLRLQIAATDRLAWRRLFSLE